MKPAVVSRDQWLIARKALLRQGRESTHLRDKVSAARRALPWVKVERDYVFESVDGPKSLGDLFQGRSQLFVQHFMLAPGSDHICEGCAGMADSVDAARRHFENADLSFAAVSRAAAAEIEKAKARLGWTFQWVSSGANSFNADYGVSFTRDQIDRGETDYNYGTTPYAAEDLPGISVFAMDEAGAVFHTYSAYTRGFESVFTPFSFLDFAPKGRNEDGTMSWVRLHDEYETAGAAPAH